MGSRLSKDEFLSLTLRQLFSLTDWRASAGEKEKSFKEKYDMNSGMSFEQAMALAQQQVANDGS